MAGLQVEDFQLFRGVEYGVDEVRGDVCQDDECQQCCHGKYHEDYHGPLYHLPGFAARRFLTGGLGGRGC